MTTDHDRPPVVCFMGPTAAGKTALAMAYADQHDADLVSVDSAMIYRGMDIGTAKPGRDELERYPHALIDIIEPNQSYSAAQFCTDANRLIAQSYARQRQPVLVGGTMMYYYMLQFGYHALPASSPDILASINQEAASAGWPAMHTQLMAIDPATARTLDSNDAQRIQRALAIYRQTGQTQSALQSDNQFKQSPHQFDNRLINPDRPLLHERIADRFDAMMDAGFMDEVKTLKQRPDLHLGLPSMRCVGYRQAWLCLEGDIDQATMREQAIIATRQLAKRQCTWLKKFVHPTT